MRSGMDVLNLVEEWLKRLSDEELKEYYKSLWEAVNVSDCFSAYDVLLLHKLEGELRRRGYEVREDVMVKG